ncbi:phage N-6-adenine-methyltransferase [Klebsiella pneumoniae]|uniref:phage N-6-adenine-methyltransferase n=1 Tax=Klebsiella pneumoniae TaxID=573 RepID=UPI002556FF95|nr:phage N-6-adenine-methyltransferase [Klebsiella pneumoniae]MEC5980692.1 phage N-6-adenine-methyltransferase [Klebsiella pneumoniae]
MNGSQKIKNRERDGSLRDLWRTPIWLFKAIEVYLGMKFQVDVACNKDNALLPDFIGVERDALKSSWGSPGTTAFLNPPYSKIKPWIDAATREQANGVTTVMLVPQSLDTQWYLDVKRSANQTVLIVGGRVAFMEPDTNLGLVEVRENTGGSMLLVFRGFCGGAGHQTTEIDIGVMKSLGGYDPLTAKRKPRKKPVKKPLHPIMF